ncbi:MAG TPA: glycine zipper 2TM domain-containing protein, partial [Gemmatimonadales bacterium]|nr:glycine zipper 2TM domain-containing protein [Gemmatimonadales bacterium]
APTESTAAIRDVPAGRPEAAKPTSTPEHKTPAPAPKPPAPAPPTTLTAAAGTRVPLAISDTITTRHVKAGDPFTATVSAAVKDAQGHVVIPAGSTVQGTIDAAEARKPNSTGQLVLSVHSVTVRGTTYPVLGSIASMDTVEQGRGVTAGDAEKVGAGAAAGALVGKLIGKDTKGALIGGLVGAAAGAGAARETRSIDLVLPKGAAVTFRLDAPLTVKRG